MQKGLQKRRTRVRGRVRASVPTFACAHAECMLVTNTAPTATTISFWMLSHQKRLCRSKVKTHALTRGTQPFVPLSVATTNQRVECSRTSVSELKSNGPSLMSRMHQTSSDERLVTLMTPQCNDTMSRIMHISRDQAKVFTHSARGWQRGNHHRVRMCAGHTMF